MNIPGPLRAIIAANGTANGLLSGRIYPKVAPKGYTLPLAVINVISTNPSNTKTGVSDADIALVQIDAYGETYASAAAVSEAVRQAIDHYRGDVVAGSNTYGIDLIEFAGAQDEYEEDAKVYRFLCEYTLRYMRNGITGVVADVVGLQTYNSDAEAVTDGLSIGDFYVTGLMHENLISGVLKQITAQDNIPHGPKSGSIMISPSDKSHSPITTGVSKAAMLIGSDLDGLRLSEIIAAVSDPSTSGNITIQVRRVRGGNSVDMLSTVLSVDENMYDSTNSSSQVVINAANSDVLTADQLHFDVISPGTDAYGLTVNFKFIK